MAAFDKDKKKPRPESKETFEKSAPGYNEAEAFVYNDPFLNDAAKENLEFN